MFGYYFDLALRSFRRNKMLTALMVVAIALGIGACMTTLTVFHVLSGDPIPQKSSRLFYVQLDPRNMDEYTPGQDPNFQMTRFDGEALLREKRADRQALMTAGSVAVEPQRQGVVPFLSSGRYTSADFFPMFDVPFQYGGGWKPSDDEGRARVAVISRDFNDRVFGGGNSVGKSLHLQQTEFRVIGVLDDWRPSPRFYDITGDRFGKDEEVFIPLSTSIALKMGNDGDMTCWGDSNSDEEGSHGLNAPCAWLQYWVELPTSEKVAAYRQYLGNYSDQQRQAGRFVRPTNVAVTDVMGWLEKNNAVPSDVRMQLWLAMGFLLVCIVNTIGLLLAKFLRRSGEIGVRRALGASRRAIFAQCLVEAGTVGVVGGILGLGLAMVGLWAVRQQPVGYAELAHLDPTMLIVTFVISVGAAVLAGLLPAWRACQVTPAIQLKSQ
ncbi:ABC transporter permease [Lysobacter sp. LF1]|uniref:ABC transporter permease n=1 Tax=Lysobacter stagni TaxID=3045172 RepID=A0ABT6XC15_9GAMM|nr:ABC transporter permease [Lysobacter sp. LF1]MDI9237687.1 ABC transporter permease [Lysobacter sp. LF1]